jgi:hypothetical protein
VRLLGVLYPQPDACDTLYSLRDRQAVCLYMGPNGLLGRRDNSVVMLWALQTDRQAVCLYMGPNGLLGCHDNSAVMLWALQTFLIIDNRCT